MKLESIVKMTQNELKSAAAVKLTELGYTVKTNPGYLYAKGTVPVLLVAHLDTVHKKAVRHIFYSDDKSLVMSPEGIGGDDRAGVAIIFQVISKLCCHVLLCEDEEIGGVGARAFARSKIKPKVNYIIEVDRRGHNDAVFYGCDNPEFTDFVLSFDFEKAHGSFSDISVIAPKLGVAAVNLSAGYYNEHTKSEFVSLVAMQNTARRIIQMVSTQTKKYPYMERELSYARYGQQVLDLWGHIGAEQSKERKVHLMPLDNSSYLTISGHLTEGSDNYLIDIQGNVYNYIPLIDAAVPIEHAEAYTHTGTSLPFTDKNSTEVKVVQFETAMELLECI